MFTEIHTGTLLTDEELADQVWKPLKAGEADDETACIASMLIVML